MIFVKPPTYHETFSPPGSPVIFLISGETSRRNSIRNTVSEALNIGGLLKTRCFGPTFL